MPTTQIWLSILCFSYMTHLNSTTIPFIWTGIFSPLAVIIPMSEEIINTHKRTIIKNSIEEELFIKDITDSIKSLDMLNLSDIPSLEKAINNLAKDIDNT